MKLALLQPFDQTEGRRTQRRHAPERPALTAAERASIFQVTAPTEGRPRARTKISVLSRFSGSSRAGHYLFAILISWRRDQSARCRATQFAGELAFLERFGDAPGKGRVHRQKCTKLLKLGLGQPFLATGRT
jgi:hypothetical protein